METWPSTTWGCDMTTLDTLLRRHGVRAVIVVPHGNSVEKNAAVRALGGELLEYGDDFQACQEYAQSLSRRDGSSQRHWQWVEQARQRALQPAQTWLTVEGLCRELHVTRRTLQNGFQEVTAMSPLPFLRALRLNQVRRLLRSPWVPLPLPFPFPLGGRGSGLTWRAGRGSRRWGTGRCGR